MAKADWGTKRICQSCGAKYYDMQRTPISCPKCGVAYDPDALLRSRKVRSAPKAAPAAPAAPIAAVVPDPVEAEEATDDEELEKVAAGDEDLEDAEAEDESLIEDASELGEDDDDMADVVVEDDDKDA